MQRIFGEAAKAIVAKRIFAGVPGRIGAVDASGPAQCRAQGQGPLCA